ncbi:hypothetical protein AMTR_s00062p00064770 [Amborella trichopoda]|uniref:Fe2OG dioxygenase domain-containing protein n=1 Tax=Amborella trichopoda TaxID=13333 RepID=U5DGJ8_AMBTC|nr:hypothetical protein AMTR_s00062p00064770 [Amborella trichopoda]
MLYISDLFLTCPLVEDRVGKRVSSTTGTDRFGDACIAYGKEAEKLAHKILELIALSLGLPAKRFVPFFEGKNMTFNRINYYRPCPNPELVLGKGCHTDTSSVTVVATNDVSGLEIKTREGTFLKVNPLPGSYIINLGEAMNVWSNGYYESSDHRAVAPKDRHRFSMAFSLGPAPDMMVEPLEELINEDHPRRFTGFKYGKFWRSRRHTSLLRLKEQNIRARHFKIRE